MVLDAIPLLPNGKIDRKALPLPGPEEKAERDSVAAVGRSRDPSCANLVRNPGGQVGRRDCGFLRAGWSLLARCPSARPSGGGVRASNQHVGAVRVTQSSLHSRTCFVPSARGTSTSARLCGWDRAMREQSIFAINNTGIFLTLSHRLNEDLSITALQLFDPLIKRENLPATIEETARRICPVDPRGSGPRPICLAGMVQWRHAGVRDGPSTRGGWESAYRASF